MGKEPVIASFDDFKNDMVTVGETRYRVNPQLLTLEPKGLVKTAKHEAGHAITAKLVGGTVREIAIYAPDDEAWEQDGLGGAVRHRYVWDAFKKLMIRTSGLAGELIDEDNPRPFFRAADNLDPAPGTDGDIENIDHDALEGFIGPGSVQCHPDFDRIRWINEAYFLSHQLLRQFRPVFDELVAALLEKKSLRDDAALVILCKLPRKAPRSKLYTWKTTRDAIKALEVSNPDDPRLAVYLASKRAMDINTASSKASMALNEAKKLFDEAKATSDRAQAEIQYMLRNGKSLLEAKKQFLGYWEQLLATSQEALTVHRKQPWQQRNWRYMQGLRANIKKFKARVALHKTELKALMSQEKAKRRNKTGRA
jgi:hypothetical protein